MTSNTSPKRSPQQPPPLSSSPSNTSTSSKQNPSKISNLNDIKLTSKPTNTNNASQTTNPQSAAPPPELAPLKSPSPDRFKGIKLPIGWLNCPLEFIQPLPDYRILVCKTPIDKDIAEHLKIQKNKYFLPHTIYTLPHKHFIEKLQQQNLSLSSTKKRPIGLVIDLTNQMYYDEISFNNGKKTNKVLRRVIHMKNISSPSEGETSGFIGLVNSFLNSANNKNKWIVIHCDLGYNLCGYFCCAFMVKELNYSVDAAVYQFNNTKKPGIYNANLIRLLHEMYSDKEDLNTFEQLLKLRPLQKPLWLNTQQKKKKVVKKKINLPMKNGFAVPTTSLRRKRPFPQGNDSINNSESLLSEPVLMKEPVEPQQIIKSPTNIIMEPKLLGPTEPSLIMEPPMKKRRMDIKYELPNDLKQSHSYLIAVGSEHLQNLTTIVLQLSKTKELFHSIQNKPATIPCNSLMSLKNNYRISWLGNGYVFWLMILGKKGCFFVDPSYFKNGKLGGIYHINGTQFINDKTNEYMDGTLCCGELVIDNIVINKQMNKIKKVPRFLITDMLVFDKQSLSKFPHTERLMRAENYLYKPFAKNLQNSKLRIRVKPMYNIENLDIVNKLKKMIDNELPHKCNGLGLFPIKQPFGQRILRITL